MMKRGQKKEKEKKKEKKKNKILKSTGSERNFFSSSR